MEKAFMKKSREPLTILHLLCAMGETSAPYNEHCLALSDKRNITICTLFKPELSPPKEITLFEGDRSVKGFLRVLKAALDEKEYEIIHAHSCHVGFLSLVDRVFRPGKSTPATVFTVHSSYPRFKLRNKLLLIPVFAFFRRVVCCSKASYESFPAFYKWLAGDRLCFVPNGMDLDRGSCYRESARIRPKG
jgi:glycosyltransferase involved in cell wall biosynthesis